MKTLIITDLERSHQLDRPTMTAVRGGWKLAAAPHAAREATRDAAARAAQDARRVQAGDDVTLDGQHNVERR